MEVGYSEDKTSLWQCEGWRELKTHLGFIWCWSRHMSVQMPHHIGWGQL